jgi:serine phosphatase RsbU (regulator of sigma subunit)
MLCTACCFDVATDSAGAVIRYANAAHPPLLQLTAGGLRELYRDGPFLGIAGEIEVEQAEFRLAAGDRLFAYTDGSSDQTDASGGIFDFKKTLAGPTRATSAGFSTI